jgi:hypothetical protein
MCLSNEKESRMAYADDLAKDRDKYRIQRNQLMGALETVLLNPTARTRADAQRLLRKIEASDPIANMVTHLQSAG